MNSNTRMPARQWRQVLYFVLMALAIAVNVIPAPVIADDINKLAGETQKQIKNAENKMFSGRNDEAAKLLDEAEVMIDSIKAAAPNHGKLRSLEASYDRTRKALEKKMQPKAQPAPTATVAPKAGQTDKLPGGVSKRLKDIGEIHANIESHMQSGGSTDRARYLLGGAAETFAEIDRQYGGKFSPEHPDFKEAKLRFAEIEQKIKDAEGKAITGKEQAAATKDALEAQSREWVRKFTPYVANPAREGHNPDKYLFFPGTSDPQAIAKMQKVSEELAGLLAEYRKTEFPHGKTWQLEEIEGEAKRALENYSGSSSGGIKGVVDQASSELDQALAQLNNPQWKSDPAATPPIIDRNWASRIDGMVAQAAQILPAGDPLLVSLKTKHEQMKQLDSANRNAWAERTFMRPEIYKGKELKDIRAAAEEIVAREIPGAKVLRISVYKDAWKEESVLEHTDTTQTAVRHRVTRMINAQVAAREEKTVRLHTLHIAQDKQSDGWGKLYGNVMSSDIMLEKNVNRNGP